MQMSQMQLTLTYTEKHSNPHIRLGQIVSNNYDIPKEIEDQIWELDGPEFKQWIADNNFVDYSAVAPGLKRREKEKD